MPTDSSGDYSHLTIVKPVKCANHLGAAIILIALAFVGNAFWKGDIAWSYVSANLFEYKVVGGVGNTIIMTICAMLLGIALGVIAALMRMSENVVLRSVAVGYIWIFRGTPALLQLLLWFNLALIFPTISLFGLFPVRTVDVMTPFVAALIGLGLQQGAYTAEVVRAGVLSVDRGQTEAAQSVGMTKLRAMFSIVLPQAMRVIVPPIGNETIGMVKLTSSRGASKCRGRLLPQLQSHRAPDRGCDLVHDHRNCPQYWPTVFGATFLAGMGT